MTAPVSSQSNLNLIFDSVSIFRDFVAGIKVRQHGAIEVKEQVGNVSRDSAVQKLQNSARIRLLRLSQKLVSNCTNWRVAVPGKFYPAGRHFDIRNEVPICQPLEIES